MLIQFAVENYRSIKNRAVISFAASGDKSFEEYLIYAGEGMALLPVLALCGANAVGKSNVLHAIMMMKEMVAGNTAKVSKGKMLPWEPFAGTKEPTAFEVVFIFQGVLYTYGFSFDEKQIYKEYLYQRFEGHETLIFSRENGIYEFQENVNEQMILSNRTPDNKLYLVSSNDWNLPQTENAYRWFQEKLTFLIDNELSASTTAVQISCDDDKKARIIKEFLRADLGITDITVGNDLDNVPVITTTHRIIKEDGTVECFRLLMEQESIGTQQFFAYIGKWLQALENGALLVVDKLEASLHSLLTRRLIEMIQDKTINTRGAQLIFTTHDAMLLDLKFFRRDQIWFVEKNEEMSYYYSGNGTLTELKCPVLCGGNTSYDSQISPYKVEDYAFSKLRERYKKWTGNSFDEKDLISFGIANEQGFLTNAGALIVDESPIWWSRLFCTRWNGLSKGGGSMDALDDAEYSGSILSLIENGEAFIKRNIRMMWRKTANSREELPEYVERSYHEALINALAHRDYLVNGSEVHIDIYDDRMEIYSPGGMTDGSMIQDCDPLTVPSTRRNPVLTNVLNRLGYMECNGSGFGKIISGYETQINYTEIKKPTFRSDRYQFTVIMENLNFDVPDIVL